MTPHRFRTATLALAIAALLGGAAAGTSTFADDSEEGEEAFTAAPGDVIAPSVADATVGPRTETVTTGGAGFDPSTLTSFVSARAFIANQGSGIDFDRVVSAGADCVAPEATSGTGTLTVLRAPLQLPDGARITRVIFLGEDSGAADIAVALVRTRIVVPSGGGTPARSDLVVTSFTTSGTPGPTVVANPGVLEEITGSMAGASPGSIENRFYALSVTMSATAGFSSILCGVEVEYQVASSGEVSYHPIAPVRAFDSRVAAYVAKGILGPGASRVISIANGHDLTTGVVTVANAVPPNATAITYNLTAADPVGGSNFLAITAGDATVFAASALNYNNASIANGGTVPINVADRTVKIWNGGAPASTHVVIDITGYYLPSDYPNFGD